MIDFGAFHFACPPRCGASFFLRAMDIAGMTPVVMGASLKYYSQVQVPFWEKGDDRPMKVSLVRHPWTWLLSYWSTGSYVRELKPLSDIPNDGRLEVWIEEYLRMCPGFVGELYKQYDADCVYRIEDFPDCFVELGFSMGVPADRFSHAYFKGWRPLDDVPGKVVCDPGLRKRVMEAERWVVDQYDYW